MEDVPTLTQKIWKPHARQVLFATIPDSVFEGLYGGAAGGGKSELLLMLPIIRGFYKEPRFKGIIFRRTFPELEKEIIVRSHEWYKHAGGKWSEDKKRWTFPSGAIMQFGHVEYEADVRKYDSSEYNYMAFDELTSFTLAQYLYLTLTRCRSSSSRLPAIARSATNPGNIGHNWVNERFIKVAPYGSIAVDKKTSLKRIFIQSFAEDNPYLMKNDPQYVNRLDALPEAERRAKRYGDWNTFEGQVFGDYREFRLDDEPENAVHVIQPFAIPDWWVRFLAIDWGYTAMTIALWGALSPDDRLYVYREYAVKETKVSTWATEIGNLSVNERFADIVLCQSAWQTRGDDQTIDQQFIKYSGLLPRRADNDRVAGKLLVQEFLRWRESPSKKITPAIPYSHETAAFILRQQGMDAYKDYLSSFEEKKEANPLPRLQIFENCFELRKCIPLCIYDKRSNVSNKPAEDVKEFDGDDPYDDLRYLCSSANNYLGNLKREGDVRKEINDVVSQLEQTQDWTEFYRKMAMIEGKGRNTLKPVKRYHHALAR